MSQLNRLNLALQSRPDDPFLLYAVAMEYQKLGDFQNAIARFEALTKSHPNYIPTYLQYGLTLAEQRNLDSAKLVFEAGQKIALQSGDLHTASEISQALQSLHDEF